MTGFLLQRPRERRLAIIAGVLIVCWLLVSWLVQPLWEMGRDQQRRMAGQIQKLHALGRLLAQGASVERRYQVFADYLEPHDEEPAQRAFLNELEALSRSANVTLSLKPKPLKEEARMSRFEVELDVEGVQPNLMTFLDAVFHLPRLMTIERLRISHVPAKANLLRATLVVQKLTVQ